MDWKFLYPHQSKRNRNNSFLHTYRFREEWTLDVVAPGCRKDNDRLPKLTKSSNAPVKQAAPGHSTAVPTVNAIHVVEVYGHEDRYKQPSCRIPG